MSNKTMFGKSAFFTVLAACACASGLWAQSFGDAPKTKYSAFSQVFADVVFFSPEQALEAYSGSWGGTQSISVGDRQVATAVVEQNYYPSRDVSMLKLVGSAKLMGAGATVPTRCYMYVENGKLRLDIKTADDLVVPYSGIVEDNRVIWVPYYGFFLYDVQTDTFSNSPDGLRIDSRGEKFVSLPVFTGIMEIDSVLVRSASAYSANKVRTSRNAKFEFPTSKMQD